MTAIPERIHWRREWPFTDPYERVTAISFPEKGVPDCPLVIMMARGLFLHVESKVMARTRQEIANALDAIVVESSFFESDYINTPSSRHSYSVHPQTLAELGRKDGFSPNTSIEALVDECASHSVTPVLTYTATKVPRGVEHIFFFQAMDIMRGLHLALDLLIDQGFSIKKVVASGVSFGANLVHLCHLLRPELFSLVVDDSSIGDLSMIGQQWTNSILLRGAKVSFLQDFSSWLSVVNPDSFSPLTMYEINEENIPHAPLVFYAADEDTLVASGRKIDFAAKRPNCHTFLARKDNLYLDGLYNSGTHADSDHLATLGKALEYSWDEGNSPLPPPQTSKIKTQKYLYKVDNPFTPEEKVTIQERKGET